MFTLKPPQDALEIDLEGRCAFTLAFTKVRRARGPDHRATAVTMTVNPEGLMEWHGEPSALAEQEQAHEYQASGLSQRQIAEAMNVSVGKVNKLLRQREGAEAYRRVRG